MMSYVLIGLRSLIALVFVFSIAGKLRGRRAFDEFLAATVRLSPRPLPAALARWLAAGVVAIELAVVLLLTMPATTPIGFAVAAALLLGFTGTIVLALRRGERAPCRCFGSTTQPLGYPQVARNLVLLAAAALGLAGGQLPAASPDLAGALVAVGAGALAATVVTMADDITSLFRPV
ncbi:MauE/DoxX family redox-associated membrane protein [Phytohabitans aurantiacus]|jgi:hypothetical protein|uniref:Methylamine utilization protein MauE n=1 Tax=Phytohabitans aurantiacus TaxID=3016789 RepID=A0ABQ5QV64_9ACTN|nr:MauE/DoxX family redox-associated membrane protein [Phytohabitans aurantiacus]GLH98471.1 methylamine utilization protein MauE [Phytohabitans aurantiacus]